MRLQLALNVKDLDAAVDFYSKMFGVPANKREPGYANFAVESPPLKLVLFESPDAPERLNHLGVEVFEDEAVAIIERGGLGQVEQEFDALFTSHGDAAAMPAVKVKDDPVGCDMRPVLGGDDFGGTNHGVAGPSQNRK